MTDLIVSVLCGLINIDTTRNASGEIAAARYLERFFSDWRIECRIFEPYSGRGSIVARIPGKKKDGLLLLSHLDTEDYTAPRGASASQAEIRGGRVFGRGALDCKGNAAVLATVMKTIHDSKLCPEKTILFAATAGEEDGGGAGIGWLLDHTDVFDDVRIVIGEGGGIPLPVSGRQFFTLQTGEGNGDCSGLPAQEEQNLLLDESVKLGILDENTRQYLACLPEIERGRRMTKESLFSGLPFVLDHHRKDGLSGDRNARRDLFARCMGDIDPSYGVMSIVTPGYSDNRYFRERGIETWGFFPLDPANGISGIHGKNEYISTRTIRLAYRCMTKITKEISNC